MEEIDKIYTITITKMDTFAPAGSHSDLVAGSIYHPISLVDTSITRDYTKAKIKARKFAEISSKFILDQEVDNHDLIVNFVFLNNEILDKDNMTPYFIADYDVKTKDGECLMHSNLAIHVAVTYDLDSNFNKSKSVFDQSSNIDDIENEADNVSELFKRSRQNNRDVNMMEE